MNWPTTKVFSIGGARNIGYHAALRLLRKGATVTFLLRDPSVFNEDHDIQSFVRKGNARIIKGDALVKDDLKRAWELAGRPIQGEESTGVDVLIFTIGVPPKFTAHGMVIDPLDICARTMINTLATMPRTSPTPRIVAMSTTGLTRQSVASVPFAVRMMYKMAKGPQRDKKAMERVLARMIGLPDFEADLLPKGWQNTEGLPGKGEVKSIVVVRPAVLTDGECKAVYRTRCEGDALAVKGGYTVSRQDVAHLIVEKVLGDKWYEWEGKGVNVAY